MIKIKKIVAVICAFLLLLEQNVYASGTEQELEIDVEEMAEKEVLLEEEHLERLPKILQDFSGEQRIEFGRNSYCIKRRCSFICKKDK